MSAGAPIENTNAEKWTVEEAISLFNESIKSCQINGYDFIGEVAQDQGTYRDIYTYLKNKYKECKPLYKRLQQECEANCFSHGKKGDIVPSMAIVNLKSNHGWTDRVDNTTQGEKIETGNKVEKVIVEFVDFSEDEDTTE